MTETGQLIDPQWNRSFPTVEPLPGDNVHLMLQDNRGNLLVYLFQRAPNYTGHTTTLQGELGNGQVGTVGYHEVLLDASDAPGGTFVRDLFADFNDVPGFTVA
jgi:hypothetical protein